MWQPPAQPHWQKKSKWLNNKTYTQQYAHQSGSGARAGVGRRQPPKTSRAARSLASLGLAGRLAAQAGRRRRMRQPRQPDGRPRLHRRRPGARLLLLAQRLLLHLLANALHGAVHVAGQEVGLQQAGALQAGRRGAEVWNGQEGTGGKNVYGVWLCGCWEGEVSRQPLGEVLLPQSTPPPSPPFTA